VNAATVVWSVVALAIAGLTVWGNIEFWRRGRSRRVSRRSDMSGFSDTIDQCESRPLIHPDGLEVRRRGR
jgi:hypothetical protein